MVQIAVGAVSYLCRTKRESVVFKNYIGVNYNSEADKRLVFFNMHYIYLLSFVHDASYPRYLFSH